MGDYQKLNISILVPGMPFHGDTLDKESLGGSETAGFYMARELAKMGHTVDMFTNCEKPGMYDNVLYHDIAEWQQHAQFNPHDVCIVQRTPEAFLTPTSAKVNMLWNHDLAMGRELSRIKGAMWGIDKIMVVSEYMSKQYKEVYDMEDDAFFVTRNGIDLKAFNLKHLKRNRKRIMFSARPERGLDVLLKGVFPKLLAKDPEYVLDLCTYKNTSEQLEPFYAEIGKLLESFGRNVNWLGNLTKAELYKHYSSAGAYVYPTPSPIMKTFTEVSCITAMECMASGLPVVTSDRGALKETLGNAGIFIDGDCMSDAYQDEMVEKILQLSQDDRYFNQHSKLGLRRAAELDWSGVAKDWTSKFNELIAKNNDDPIRLANHFLRRSDIIAAKALLEPVHSKQADDIKKDIQKNYGFINSARGFQTQYEKIGKTHTDVFEASAQEPRFRHVKSWLDERPDVDTIMDYGCAHGSYAVNLHNQTGKSFSGVDLDKTSIDWAKKFAKTKGKDPSKLDFRVGDLDVDMGEIRQFDCLLAMEVLEHVAKPWEVLNRLEKWIKPGGTVYITVPYGPWEWMSYDTYPHRCHIWEFDKHDLHDIFGKKKGLIIGTLPFIQCQALGEPLGWHVIEYTVDHKIKCGEIDMERKLKHQRPRQTVSAVMIAGPKSEDQLRWCLGSMKDLVDEIIIGNTGMSEEAIFIAESYGAIMIDADDPKEKGFETPRNQALEHATMDWIFWIDTDEKLVNTENIFKYLRQNIFNGYSIRQHHFAVDTEFSPDMPVRLFRRKPYKGEKMQWYGMIHEHPELGLNNGPGPTIVLSDVHIPHTGYLVESGRRLRFKRNLPLLQMDREKYPDRLLQKHFVMRDNMLLNTYEMQQNGGHVTEEVRDRAQEVVDLYRKHFLGQAGYMTTDSLQYYSQAVALLGGGIEVAFSISASRDKASPGTQHVARFANEEDFISELTSRAKAATAPYLKETY